MQKRIFGLDILRAIAILSVLIGHTFFTLPITARPILIRCVFFDGVNIFFTLSGFLIGSILLKKLSEKQNFSTIATFWRDRWLRTLPAYFVVLIVIMLIEGGHPGVFKRHVLFLQNLTTGEFTSFRESWSLAIEEWFYLTTPILFIIALRFLPLRIATPVVIATVFIAGNIIRAVKMQHIVDYNDFLWHILMAMPTRIDAVSFGVLGAYLHFYKFKVWTNYRNTFFWIGVIGFFANHYYAIFSDFNFYIKYIWKQLELLFVLMTIPKLVSVKEGKGIAAKAITFVALISYSLYLVHGAIFIEVIRPVLFDNLKIQIVEYYVWAFAGAFFLYSTVEKWGLRFRDYLKRRAERAVVIKMVRHEQKENKK